jgi:aerobic-type carbon monoxide dehydrogenase small subunit (CoxS/CutS family)
VHKINLTFTVNGGVRTITTEPHRTLLNVLRENLDLISVKEGCAQGDCGACVVIMDGFAVNSCLVLAPQAQGSEIITAEGLAQNSELHPLQKMFIEKWAFQCGYCTPGMLMSCYALLLHNPNPTPDEVMDAISGNLCRCTGYQAIIDAVLAAVAS